MMQRHLEGLLFAVAAAAFFAFSTSALAADMRASHALPQGSDTISSMKQFVTAWLRAPVIPPFTSPDREKA